MKALEQIMDKRRREILAVLMAFALFTYAGYLYRYNHHEPLSFAVIWEYVTGFVRYMIVPWLITMFLAVCAYVVGRAGLKLVARDIEFRNNLEESIYCIGIGLGLIGVGTFVIGLAHMLYPALFAFIAILILGLGREHVARLFRVLRSGVGPVKLDLLEGFLWLLIGALVLSMIFRPNNPSFGGDPMNSHLAAPKCYLRDHAVTFIPWINFNNFPLLQEMLLTVQMMFLKDPGCSLIYLYLMGSAGLTYLMGTRWFSRHTGLIAAALLLLVPEIYVNSQAAYVELVLVFYSLLSVYGFLGWYESGDRRWLVLVGVSCGLACGVKYLGTLSTLVILILMAIGGRLRMPQWERDLVRHAGAVDNKRDASSLGSTVDGIGKNEAGVSGIRTAGIAKSIGIVLLWTAIVASPWYIRNIVMFGNPFFPFFESIFGGLGFGTMNSLRAELSVDHAWMLKYFTFKPTMYNLAALPWDATFHHNHPNAYHMPARVGPFLLAFSPAVVFVRRWRRVGMMLIMFSVLFYGYWYLVERIDYQRYMLSVFPVHCIIAAWGLSELFRLEAFDPRNRRQLAWLMLGVSLGFMFYVKSTINRAYSGRRLIFVNEQERRNYLDARFPGWEIIEGVNSSVASGGRWFDENTFIYGLASQNRRFYLDCPLIGSPWAYASYFKCMEHAQTGEELYEWLRSYNCEYILFSEDLARSMAYILDIHLPNDSTFALYFEPLVVSDDCSLYRLAGPGQERAGPSASGPGGIEQRFPVAEIEEATEVEETIEPLTAPF